MAQVRQCEDMDALHANQQNTPRLAGWKQRVYHFIPAIDSLRTYSLSSLGRDLTAGLTVATVAVPQSMAYATLAGLPPQYGLYTAIVMTAVGALFDSSRQLINGPTNAISIALLSALVMVPEPERVHAAISLALFVGSIQLGISLLRLGDLTQFVSHSVIDGFTLGAAILLVLDQTKHWLGLTPQGQPSDHFLVRFWLTISGGPVHWPTVFVGTGTVLVVVLVRQLNSWLRQRRFRFPIPQHLVGIAAIGFVVWFFQLQNQGVKIVGEIPSTLPEFSWPMLKWEQARMLAGNAFAIAVLGVLEAVAMAKAIAARTGQKLDPNQQCFSEGAANLVGSLFNCFPGSGSLTRSAVNQQAGAVSQWSGVFSAIAVAATVLFLAPLAGYIPRASLAGLLILAAYRMVDSKQLLFHLQANRFDAGVLLTTAAAAIFISIEFCIIIGVFLSFALYVIRAARVRLTRFPTDEPRLIAFELDGELFFGTEAELAKHLAVIRAAILPEVKLVVLFLCRGRNPDSGFLLQLQALHDGLKSSNVILLLGGVESDMLCGLNATGLFHEIGAERILSANISEHEVLKIGHRMLEVAPAE
jgi:sulfate permease, SulP family